MFFDRFSRWSLENSLSVGGHVNFWWSNTVKRCFGFMGRWSTTTLLLLKARTRHFIRNKQRGVKIEHENSIEVMKSRCIPLSCEWYFILVFYFRIIPYHIIPYHTIKYHKIEYHFATLARPAVQSNG